MLPTPRPRKIATLISLLFVTSTLALAQGFPGPAQPRVSKGIYATLILNELVNQAETVVYPPPAVAPQYPNPNGTPGLVDDVIVKYLLTLLSNPAVSGLAPQMSWVMLTPNNPGPDPLRSAPGAYAWSPLDDVFIAVTIWNLTHIGAPPKTIQLIISQGFNSPPWVWSDIDASVCGPSESPGCGSCDPLFMTPATAPPVSTSVRIHHPLLEDGRRAPGADSATHALERHLQERLAKLPHRTQQAPSA